MNGSCGGEAVCPILMFFDLVAAVAWHPVHEGMFASGGSDGSLLFWNVG